MYCMVVCMQAKQRGLVATGDRVVVSQCPRVNSQFDCMQEAGVVKILTVEDRDLCLNAPQIHPLKVAKSGNHIIGSQDDLTDTSDLV